MSAARAAVDAVWRIESAKLIGGLVRMVRDVGFAEELAQEALVAALETWPASGIPENPGAWLMSTAKNRARDALRRKKMVASKSEALGHHALVAAEEAERARERALEALEDSSLGEFGDDVLRLMFIACHPVLSTEARVALTLRLLGGLSTEEVARAFLLPEATIAQRIVRAKRTLAEAKVPFELPQAAEVAPRLASVLEAIYLVFNEGYAATRGDDWMRPALCEDALRLGRMLAVFVPDEPEVHGLVALMEINASRTAARVSPTGEPVLLLEQDRLRWDQLLIRRGLAALDRAEALCARADVSLGPYALQAAIAACHGRARVASDTDWARVVALYDALFAVTESPVVALNRAVAVGMAFGAEEGLEMVDAIADEPSLRDYPFVPSVRGDLLEKVGRTDEARHEFERAAFMTKNARDKALLLARAKACKP